MSTQSIDISKKNISGKCDLKCAYNFNYPESNTTSKNNSVFINLIITRQSIFPVLPGRRRSCEFPPPVFQLP